MNNPLQKLQAYSQADFTEPLTTPFLSGQAVFFTARAPDKTTPNEDCLALLPFDAESGQVTAGPVLDAVGITKNIDKASPGLGKAFHTGQTLEAVTLKFLRPTPEDAMEEYFRITLTNVRIVGFAQRVVHRGSDEYAHLDVVEFVWQRLQWKWFPDTFIEEIEWRPSSP